MTDSQSSTTSGYHLFLGSTDSGELQKTIQKLAHAMSGPVFGPHVTLLSGIQETDEDELIRITAALAADQSSFTLSLDGLGMEDRYFRALYLRVQENQNLLALHERAAETFSIQSPEPYMPHLSLLYGNYPEGTKLEILDSVQVPEEATFTVNMISLYKTEGGVQDWMKIREFILS